MKIGANNIYSCYTTQKENAKLQIAEKNQRKIDKNFDKIVLHSSSDSNDKFISDITNKLSNEVRKSASTEKLEYLQKKVAEGTYQIDLDAIVKKILF